MDFEKFEKDMVAFTFGQHQDVMTYLDWLKRTGWTVGDAQIWFEGEKQKIAQQVKSQKNTICSKLISINCPECTATMKLLPVNFTKATLTGEGSKSVWLCQNKNCMNTIYNKESVNEITRKGGT